MSENGWDRRRRRVAHDIEVAALGCFSRDGYPAVTVDQIALAAGIHVRTFFRYFATKDDVVLALPRRSAGALCSAFRDRPDGEPLYEAFATAVSVTADALHEDADLRVASGRVFLDNPDLVARAWGEFSMRLSSSMSTAVSVRLHEPTDSFRVGVVAAVLTGVMQFVWTSWVAEGGASDIVARVREAFHLIEATDLGGGRATPAEVAELRAAVADLKVEREIFKLAAAAALPEPQS